MGWTAPGQKHSMVPFSAAYWLSLRRQWPLFVVRRIDIELCVARLSNVEVCVGRSGIEGRGRAEGVGRVSLQFALNEFLSSNNGGKRRQD